RADDEIDRDLGPAQRLEHADVADGLDAASAQHQRSARPAPTIARQTQHSRARSLGPIRPRAPGSVARIWEEALARGSDPYQALRRGEPRAKAMLQLAETAHEGRHPPRTQILKQTATKWGIADTVDQREIDVLWRCDDAFIEAASGLVDHEREDTVQDFRLVARCAAPIAAASQRS